MESRFRQRQRIAIEVARRLSEYGNQDDPERLRRQVARDLGITDRHALPDRSEIESALAAQQRLFGPADHAGRLRRLRQAAMQAMSFFDVFEPRLVGAVLDGHAGEGTPIELHLHHDNPDEVALWLADRQIPCSQRSRRIRLSSTEEFLVPTYGFIADDLPVTLVVLPERALRHAPVDRLSGRAMTRADANRVRALCGNRRN